MLAIQALFWFGTDVAVGRAKFVYLQLLCESINSAFVRVEVIGVPPKQTCGIFKSGPALEIGNARVLLPAVDSLDQLLQFLDGERLLDDLIVFFERPWGQVEEFIKVW